MFLYGLPLEHQVQILRMDQRIWMDQNDQNHSKTTIINMYIYIYNICFIVYIYMLYIYVYMQSFGVDEHQSQLFWCSTDQVFIDSQAR